MQLCNISRIIIKGNPTEGHDILEEYILDNIKYPCISQRWENVFNDNK